MYFTYVVRPGDVPEGKGPQFKPFWDGLMNYNLRGGFALQLVGYLLVLVAASMGGGVLSIFEVLNGKQEKLKNVPIIMALLGSFILTVGSVSIQNFRNIADDDASIKQSRGFRAGIKALHQASLLDILASAMTTILLFSFMQYFEDDWATKKVGSGSTVIYAYVARTLHALALVLYGGSFFLLENFHGEGTAEFWGWSLCLFYKLAGIFEILALVSSNSIANAVFDLAFTVSFGIAIIGACLWAMSFELVVGKTDVKLTQSAMRNEFYKSRNAMAYYGPPAGVELGQYS